MSDYTRARDERVLPIYEPGRVPLTHERRRDHGRRKTGRDVIRRDVSAAAGSRSLLLVGLLRFRLLLVGLLGVVLRQALPDGPGLGAIGLPLVADAGNVAVSGRVLLARVGR
jgi:hypothetical protein